MPKRIDGTTLPRLADRQSLAVPIRPPSRYTRTEPDDGPTGSVIGS